LAAVILTVALTGCSGKTPETPGAAAAAPPELPGVDAVSSSLPEEVRRLVDRPFSGDLDEMVKRRVIRVGATFNRSFYFIDKGAQRGLTYEYLTLFDQQLNEKRKTG